MIFTPKCLKENVKPLIVVVKFDETLFEQLVDTSIKFWYQHLLPEIIEKKLCREGTEQKKNVWTNEDHGYALCSGSSNLFGSNCPICHVVCKDEEDVRTFDERNIGCDSCNAWFHFGCVQMSNKKLKEIGERNWYCILCTKESQ